MSIFYAFSGVLFPISSIWIQILQLSQYFYASVLNFGVQILYLDLK